MDNAALRRVLLLLLLSVTALYAAEVAPAPPQNMQTAQRGADGLPLVEAPSGELLEVFNAARPATVQIEFGSSRFQRAVLGVGTGFFISSDGLVLTAYHVVDPTMMMPGEPSWQARTASGARYDLELVGFDALRDVALLRAQGAEDVPFLTLSEDPPTLRSHVLAIGNSRGDFLQGRVGVVQRTGVAAVQARFARDTIQLTASLAPGDSGGPVLTEAGEVVGVVSYIAFSAAEPERSLPQLLPRFGEGAAGGFASYAAPVLAGAPIISELRAGLQRDIPTIGVQIGAVGIPQEYAPSHDGPDFGPESGVVVGNVVPDGPGEHAGLRSLESVSINEVASLRADIIVAIDDEPTPTFERLQAVLRERQVGDIVTLRVQRGEEQLELPLTLGSRRAIFGS